MEYAEAIMVLRGIPMFACLDPVKLKLLAFSSATLTLHDGEELFHDGEPADSVYLVEEGEAAVIAHKGGREIRITVLGRHELIGEMGVLRNRPRLATIRAVGRLTVLRIEGDVFLQVVTEDRHAALAVMRILCDKLARFVETYETLESNFARISARQRQTPP
jgi:CRP-like cAMP-binding protein